MAASASASISAVSGVCSRNVGPRPGCRTSVDHCSLSAGFANGPSIKIVSFGNAAAAYGRGAGVLLAADLDSRDDEFSVSHEVHDDGQWCSAVLNIGACTSFAPQCSRTMLASRLRVSADGETSAAWSLAAFR